MNDKIKVLSVLVGIIFDCWIDFNQDQFFYVIGEFFCLFWDIGFVVKILGWEINWVGLGDIIGMVGFENVQGEDQKMLDIVGYICFVWVLKMGGQVCCIVFEEKEELVLIGKNDVKYVIVMDLLDGFFNIEVNVLIGIVFGIYCWKIEIGMLLNVV